MILILTTTPEGGLADTIAAALVDERLAACVNISAPMVSCYRWNGAVERAIERQLVIKTTSDKLTAVRERVAQLHSYDLPEFIVLGAEGSAAYLEWVTAETAAGGSEQTR